MDVEYLHDAGLMPDRYYYQLVNNPQKAYKKQTGKYKSSKVKRQDMTFIERLFVDMAEAQLYAILDTTLNHLLDDYIKQI